MEAVQQLGAAQIDHVQYFAPYLGDLLPTAGNPDIQDYNELAKAFERMDAENGELLKYASVLSAEKPGTMQGALHLAQNLDCYERISGSLYDYGIKSFQERFALNDECIFELEEYTDFARYGQACAESNGFVQTEFGQVRRIAQQLEQVHSDEMTL